MPSPVGSPGLPAGVEQDVEEAGHREGGADRAEEEPGSQQHRRLDDALGPLARRSLHEAGLGAFAAEGEGRQRLGADVEGEELQDRERERDRAAAEGEDHERGHLGDRVGEDVEEELADVVVDAPARRDGDHDRGEVVVGEDHRRGLAGDVGARPAHRHADVGAAERGGVVDAVAGHRDDVPLGAQGVGDPQLGLGRAAREDQLAVLAQQSVELGLAEAVELLAGDDRGVLARDADAMGDRGRRQAVVAGDDDDADAGLVARGDGVGDLCAGRVEHRDQAEEAEVAFGLLADLRYGRGRLQPALGDGEDAQPLPGVARRSAARAPRALPGRAGARVRRSRSPSSSAAAAPPALPWRRPTAGRRGRRRWT